MQHLGRMRWASLCLHQQKPCYSWVDDTFNITNAVTYLHSEFAGHASLEGHIWFSFSCRSYFTVVVDGSIVFRNLKCWELICIAMDDLLDEAKEYGYDDDGFKGFPEYDEEYANTEQILGCHCCGFVLGAGAYFIWYEPDMHLTSNAVIKSILDTRGSPPSNFNSSGKLLSDNIVLDACSMRFLVSWLSLGSNSVPALIPEHTRYWYHSAPTWSKYGYVSGVDTVGNVRFRMSEFSNRHLMDRACTTCSTLCMVAAVAWAWHSATCTELAISSADRCLTFRKITTEAGKAFLS